MAGELALLHAELSLSHPDWGAVSRLRAQTSELAAEDTWMTFLTRIGGWAMIERYRRSGYAPAPCPLHGRECGPLRHCPHYSRR